MRAGAVASVLVVALTGVVAAVAGDWAGRDATDRRPPPRRHARPARARYRGGRQRPLGAPQPVRRRRGAHDRRLRLRRLPDGPRAPRRAAHPRVDRVRRLEHELTLANEQARRSSARLDAVERSYAAGVDQIGGRVTAHRRGVPQGDRGTRVAPGIFDDATAAELGSGRPTSSGAWPRSTSMSASHVANPWRSRVVSRYAWIEAAAAIFACAVSFILPFGPFLLLGPLARRTDARRARRARLDRVRPPRRPAGRLGERRLVAGRREGADPGRGRPARRRLGRRRRPTTIEPHTFALRVIPCPPPGRRSRGTSTPSPPGRTSSPSPATPSSCSTTASSAPSSRTSSATTPATTPFRAH